MVRKLSLDEINHYMKVARAIHLMIELQGKVDRYIVYMGWFLWHTFPFVCSFCRANDRMLDSSYGTQRPHD
jgi:hypothetical protein